MLMGATGHTLTADDTRNRLSGKHVVGDASSGGPGYRGPMERLGVSGEVPGTIGWGKVPGTEKSLGIGSRPTFQSMPRGCQPAT